MTDRGICSACKAPAVSTEPNDGGHTIWRHVDDSCGLGGRFRPAAPQSPAPVLVPPEYAEAVPMTLVEARERFADLDRRTEAV